MSHPSVRSVKTFVGACWQDFLRAFRPQPSPSPIGAGQPLTSSVQSQASTLTFDTCSGGTTKPLRAFATGSVRDSRVGKGRYDLIMRDCPRALNLLAKHFEMGAVKYGDGNWTRGQPLSAYVDSGTRHLTMYCLSRTEEDHLVAHVWNAVAALETRERIREGLLPVELADVGPSINSPPIMVVYKRDTPEVLSSGVMGNWL